MIEFGEFHDGPDPHIGYTRGDDLLYIELDREKEELTITRCARIPDGFGGLEYSLSEGEQVSRIKLP